VFQLVHITSSPVKKSNNLFKVGLQNVGLFMAAWSMATTPPLDGGGQFQFGVQYGAGVSIRVHRRLHLNLDFRETASPALDFLWPSFNDSDADTTYYDSSADRPQVKAGPLRIHRATIGLAFGF
jgi:hypothetical protein